MTAIAGPRPAVIRQVVPFQLHGEQYYQVNFTYEDDAEGKMHQARLAHDAIYPDPRPGHRVQVHLLLNMVMRIERLEEEG